MTLIGAMHAARRALPVQPGFFTGQSGHFLAAMLAIVALASPGRAHAQGDGPRAYQLIPDDTRVAALYGLFLSGNQTADPGTVIRGSDIDVSLGALQVTGTFNMAGCQGAVIGVLPFGGLKGSSSFQA